MANPNRLIVITWTPVVDIAVTGYNVYLVKGAPENTTKSLLAFVNGINSNAYNYTVVEGSQYQFEVRATDGTNESAPLEIFYPNGTTLATPTNLTPTGNPMMIPRDGQYVTSTEFINYATGTGINNASAIYTSGFLDTYLSIASEEVNRYTKRHFDVQTIDEVYDGVRIGQDAPRMVFVPTNESPIQNINSVSIQVLKFFIKFDLSYLQVFPGKAYYQIVPFLGAGLAAVPLPSALLIEGIMAKIWTNYTFGYDVPPNSIKMATVLLASYLYGLQENPVGAKSVRFGRNFQLEFDKDHVPIVEKAHALLDPYVSQTYRRP